MAFVFFLSVNTAEGRGAATVAEAAAAEKDGGRDGRRTGARRPLDEVLIGRLGFDLGRAVGWMPRGVI